jgi:hypothetical protein
VPLPPPLKISVASPDFFHASNAATDGSKRLSVSS